MGWWAWREGQRQPCGQWVLVENWEPEERKARTIAQGQPSPLEKSLFSQAINELIKSLIQMLIQSLALHSVLGLQRGARCTEALPVFSGG